MSEVLSYDNWENKYARNASAGSNQFSKIFQTFSKTWIDDRYCVGIWSTHELATVYNYDIIQWNATILFILIYSKNLATALHSRNLAVASMGLAWNISGMKECDIPNYELLDVLSEVVLKLSGHDTWNSSTPYNIPFKQCSKWYFIKGVRLLSIHCKECYSAAYCLELDENFANGISSQH